MYESKKTFKLRCVSTFSGMVVHFLVVPTLLWNGQQRGDADAFIVSLAVDSSDLSRVSEFSLRCDQGWTEVAHSDHNPNSGHDIYDPSDPKQLHVDVNNPVGSGYVTVYRELGRGNPPQPVGTAVNLAKTILSERRDQFLSDFLGAVE